MPAAAEKLKSMVEELPEGSTRRRVLECAQRFKASWVELGRMLSEVKREGLWETWGHKSFEAYCTKELFLRKGTAEKLTASYGFLERHEPAMIRDADNEPARPVRPVPSFEVIDVLSRAEAVGQMPEGAWEDLREEVLSDPPTPAALHRQIASRFGPPPGSEEEPRGEGDRLRKLAAMAHRLASACAAEERVSRAVVERARALADDLDDLLQG